MGMKVLILGGNGFIGRAIASECLQHGAEVLSLGRTDIGLPNGCQFVELPSLLTDDWLKAQDALSDVDAVINCWGILKGSTSQLFHVHVELPQLIARFYQAKNIPFIQISAIGPTDSEFIQSKYQFDDWLSQHYKNVSIVRPSVVVSLDGSYGGTSLIRALSATPLALFLPGDGQQKLRPVMLSDLAKAIVNLLTNRQAPTVIDACGQQELSMKACLVAFRSWLGLPANRIVFVPMFLIQLFCWFAERFSKGPMGTSTLYMLNKGNTSSDEAYEAFSQVLGKQAESLVHVLSVKPCFVQDRWHAKLYFLKTINLFFIGIVWMLSAISGFYVDSSDSLYQTLTHVGIPNERAIVYSLAIWDGALALGLLIVSIRRVILALMLTSTFLFTIGLSWIDPSIWLELSGGLLKNLLVIVAVWFAMSLHESK